MKSALAVGPTGHGQPLGVAKFRWENRQIPGDCRDMATKKGESSYLAADRLLQINESQQESWHIRPLTQAQA